jgi:hypothetical protein
LLALRRIRGWEPLNDQDHAINKWRMKATYQFLPDSFSFAAFNAGCRLQMTLGVKREGKQCNDGGKDYPRQPETPQIRKTHEVIQLVAS